MHFWLVYRKPFWGWYSMTPFHWRIHSWGPYICTMKDYFPTGANNKLSRCVLYKYYGDNLALFRVLQWHPTPVLLPGKSHRRRSRVGCHPWGREESDMIERLHFHVSLSCIGEGNGNPLQCSCLENPRGGRAWWAAVYGVAQSRTRLKRLSSSSKPSGKPTICGKSATKAL